MTRYFLLFPDVYLGRREKSILEVAQCKCFCLLKRSDCPSGTRFESQHCACVNQFTPLDYESCSKQAGPS